MKRVNIEEKTRLINEFRMQFSEKTFTSGEIREALKNIVTTNNYVLNKLLKLFPSKRIGKVVMYEIPKTPIYKSLIAACWKRNHKSDEISDDAAIQLLQSKGYQIRRIKGFDLDRFMKENPTLYKKYLVYEII